MSSWCKTCVWWGGGWGGAQFSWHVRCVTAQAVGTRGSRTIHNKSVRTADVICDDLKDNSAFRQPPATAYVVHELLWSSAARRRTDGELHPSAGTKSHTLLQYGENTATDAQIWSVLFKRDCPMCLDFDILLASGVCVCVEKGSLNLISTVLNNG